MKGVTPYTGPAQLYFRLLLRRIIQIGKLEGRSGAILDFGCGCGELKRMLKGANVVNYDIIAELSDVQNWRDAEFSILVANQVFCTFEEEKLESLLFELREKNADLELITGTSRQGLLNNAGKYLLGRPNAHRSTKLSPEREISVLRRHCRSIGDSNVLGLAVVHSWVFHNGD